MPVEAEDEVHINQLVYSCAVLASFLYWYNMLKPGVTAHRFLVKIVISSKVTLLQSYIAENVGY